jgi:hypothetical protein
LWFRIERGNVAIEFYRPKIDSLHLHQIDKELVVIPEEDSCAETLDWDGFEVVEKAIPLIV